MVFRRSSGVLLHPTSLPGRLRHRGSRPQRLRVHRSARFRRPAIVAGAAARADWLRRLPVSVFFRVCRQSADDQPRTTDRGRTAHGVRGRRPARLPTRERRLPGGDRPPPGALAARARSLRRGGSPRRCAIVSTASAAPTRTGWTTSRCSWPSRTRTVRPPGRRGSPTSRNAIHRRSRGGRPAALERSGCTN